MTPHVKHMIWAGVALALVFCSLLGWWKYIAHQDGVAHDNRVLAEERLKTDKQNQKAAEDQAARDKADYDRKKAVWDARYAQLNARIASLAASLAARQEQDRALPLPELGQRLSGLVGAVPGDVRAVPDGLFVGDDAAHKTVSLLEEIPTDRETMASQAKLIENKDEELTSALNLQASETAALDACKKAQVSADTACNARIAELKAKAKKHGFIYSLASFVAGVVLGHRL